MIENENVRQFWSCSQGENPNDHSQRTDTIYYTSVNMSTSATVGPLLVLAETPGAWDSAYTCNPKVIDGVFTNLLDDGQTYTYAIYYVATAAANGVSNSIGVAFSNNGIVWKKYPQPVITSTSLTTYGVGQPTLYNADHKSSISMFYEDTNPTLHHVAAISTDGIHFTVQGTITTNGLDSDDPLAIWGDMSYDSAKDEWYAVFCRPLRTPSTTGDVIELGQYGVELYKISKNDLLTGGSPWQQLVIMDTNSTGYESNFIAGLVHDPFGNVNVASYPEIDMYTSVSYPPPSWNSTPAEAGTSAGIRTWILMPMKWTPYMDLLTFIRYFNGSQHQVTSGWIAPDGNFKSQETLGHLYANPLHACKEGKKDYFVSLDPACEGQRILGKNGYAFAKPVSGLNLVPLYRCVTGQDHFISKFPGCEGQTAEKLLGYAAP